MTKGTEENATRKKIRRTAMDLFAHNGYAATSVRMIANEAGVNVSAISGYFGGKQQLYEECINRCLERTKDYYKDVYEEARETRLKGELTVDKAYGFLKRIIDLQIEVAFGEKYQNTMELIYKENNDVSETISASLTDIVFHQHERYMANLLMRLAPISEEQAIITSRFINGAIISFGEHRKFYREYVKWSEAADYAPQWLVEQVRNHCYAVIDQVVEDSR